MFPYHQYSRYSGQTRRFHVIRMKTAKRLRQTIVRTGKRAGTPDDRICLINGTLGDKRKQPVSVGGHHIAVS